MQARIRVRLGVRSALAFDPQAPRASDARGGRDGRTGPVGGDPSSGGCGRIDSGDCSRAGRGPQDGAAMPAANGVEAVPAGGAGRHATGYARVVSAAAPPAAVLGVEGVGQADGDVLTRHPATGHHRRAGSSSSGRQRTEQRPFEPAPNIITIEQPTVGLDRRKDRPLEVLIEPLSRLCICDGLVGWPRPAAPAPNRRNPMPAPSASDSSPPAMPASRAGGRQQ